MTKLKSIVFTVCILLTAIQITNAQGINFQGVARSANGTIIANSNISLRLSIIAKSVDATPEFVETKTVVTNTQGIFSIVVGDATNTAVTGTFKNINWADAPKFLKVEMDPAGGTNYINMGATQLQYVPYSFYSLGVAASNVNGILPLAKGGTGVGSLNELKSSLGISKISGDSLENFSVGLNALKNNSTGSKNIAFGNYALTSNTTGSNNVAIGNESQKSSKLVGGNVSLGMGTLSLNDTGSGNTAVGNLVLNKSIGVSNTAMGTNSMMNTTTGGLNTSVGAYSMMNNTVGNGNTALGHFSLIENISGNDNTAIGNSALAKNTTGSNNTSVGLTSLSKNTTGSNNTAIGNSSLSSNTTGGFNTALGSLSMQYNTTGYENIAIGGEAFRNNTTGNFSVAVGTAALVNNTGGDENSAIGRRAMNNNTTGSFNTAIGQAALYANTTGSNNTAVGRTSLVYNTGESNTAVGATSVTNNTSGFNNTGVGYYALGTNTTGMNNVALGHNADVAANNLNNATAIGAGAIVAASNSIQLGNTSVTDVKTNGVFTSSKGFLAQGITAATRDAIISPEAGYIIFCKDCGDYGEVEVFNGHSWTTMVGTAVAAPNTVLTGLNTGMVTFYQFNGNLTDASGLINNGTVTGTVNYTTDRFSQANKSGSLSTNNDIIATTNQFNNPQTIAYSFWFKTNQVGQFIGFNNGRNTHGGDWDRVISLDANGYITFYIFNGNERFLRGSVNLKDNAWHHCAVNFSSAGTVIYIDGSVAAQDNTFNLAQNGTGYYRIGGLQTGATTPSLSSNTGSIDDVRIYNRILTTNEINYLRAH